MTDDTTKRLYQNQLSKKVEKNYVKSDDDARLKRVESKKEHGKRSERSPIMQKIK